MGLEEVYSDNCGLIGSSQLSQAGKFGLIPTAITVGTGAAWLGVVSPIALSSLRLRVPVCLAKYSMTANCVLG